MEPSNSQKNSNRNIIGYPDLPLEEQEVHVLVKIVKWQGRAIILLVLALAFAIYAKVYNFNFAWPNQNAIQIKPPIIENSDQIHSLAYQDGRFIQNGDTVNKPDIQLAGEVYDYMTIKKQWPEVYLTINGNKVVVEEPTGSFKTDFALKPGSNTVETALNWNNTQHCKQLATYNYNKNEKATQNTSTTQKTK